MLNSFSVFCLFVSFSFVSIFVSLPLSLSLSLSLSLYLSLFCCLSHSSSIFLLSSALIIFSLFFSLSFYIFPSFPSFISFTFYLHPSFSSLPSFLFLRFFFPSLFSSLSSLPSHLSRRKCNVNTMSYDKAENTISKTLNSVTFSKIYFQYHF